MAKKEGLDFDVEKTWTHAQRIWFERVGVRIRSYRLLKGLTLEHVAKALGVCTATMTYIESGVYPLSLKQLLVITEVLDVTVLDLLSETETFYDRLGALDFKGRVQYFLKMNGLQKRALAEAMGVDHYGLKSILDGERTASPYHLTVMEEMLGVERDLLFGKRPMRYTTKNVYLLYEPVQEGWELMLAGLDCRQTEEALSEALSENGLVKVEVHRAGFLQNVSVLTDAYTLLEWKRKYLRPDSGR